MPFTNLTTGLQNLIFFSYEQQTKLIIIFVLFLLSLYYYLFASKNLDETDNFIIAIYRVIIYLCSITYLLFALPLFMLIPNPFYSVNSLIKIVFILYGTIFIAISVYLMFTFSVTIPLALLKIGKYNLNAFKKNKIFNYFIKKLK